MVFANAGISALVTVNAAGFSLPDWFADFLFVSVIIISISLFVRFICELMK